MKVKGPGPFKFSKKYPAAKHYTDIYRLVLILTYLSFRWTVPLMGQSNKILNLRLFMILLHLSPLLSKPELFKFESEFEEILYIFG